MRATYRVRSTPDRIDERAEALALEQTVELPAAAARGDAVGTVEAIREERETSFLVDVFYPGSAFDGSVFQLLNVLFGNSSLQPDVELVDAEFHPDTLARFGGPGFGIEGIRARTGATERAMTCAALKPVGLPVSELAGLAGTLARAGIDVIKEDHGLADQGTAPFEERVGACVRAVAESGPSSVYAAHVSGGPDRIRRQIDAARDLGAGAILIAPMLAGAPVFADLASGGIGLPVLAHPALGGASRMAPELLLGKLFRLFGADAVIFPHHGGRFAYDEDVCSRIADRLRKPWGSLRPSLPVPAGGMSVERAPELTRFYGRDVLLLIGGCLYLAGDDLEARTREFVGAVCHPR